MGRRGGGGRGGGRGGRGMRGRGRGGPREPRDGGGRGPALPSVLRKELGLVQEPPPGDDAPLKRPRDGGRGRGGGKRARADRAPTKFEAMLAADGVIAPPGGGRASAAAFDAEEALQRRLARQLGLKGAAKERALRPAVAARDVEEERWTGGAGDGGELSSSGDDGGGASDGSLLSGSDSGSLLSSSSGGSDEEEESSGGEASSSGGGEPEPQPAAPAPSGRYVPPSARRAAASSTQQDAATAAARAVTGALNRLADANLPTIGADLASLYRDAGAAAVRPALCDGLLAAASRGPRATPAFAAAAAALVAGVAGAARAPDLGAHFCAGAAAALEGAVAASDGIAGANLASLACALAAVGLLPAPALLGLLRRRLASFTDADVAVAAAVLRAAGGRLRRDAPAELKGVVVAAAAAVATQRAAGTLTPRADALLSLVLDVKNGRLAGDRGGAATAASGPGATRWLRESDAAAAALHGVTWDALLSPVKRGAWWLPPAGGFESGGGGVRGATATPPLLPPPDDDLLRLAASQRMTSEPRKAAFCVVMGAADCADAAERLLRLPLRGAAAREVVRVPVECALQESTWNPYYHHLLLRLAAAGRGHRATLRMAARDALSAAAAADDAPRAARTARLVGGLIAAHAVPLAPLAAGADLASAPPPRVAALWRALLRHALATAPDRGAAAAPFERLAVAAARPPRQAADGAPPPPDPGSTAAALRAFLRRRVVPWLVDAGPAGGVSVDELTLRARGAERALAAAERAASARGVLD